MKHWLSTNQELLLLALFVTILFIIVMLLRKKPPLKYKKLKNLCTPAERRFYQALHQAVGNEYLIFSKVRVADLILPGSSKDRSRWQSAFNKVACKHVDFVLCDEGLNIVAAIELDDASHIQKHRIERDRFVEWAFRSAKLPLVRFVQRRSYDPLSIKREIKEALRR